MGGSLKERKRQKRMKIKEMGKTQVNNGCITKNKTIQQLLDLPANFII